MKKKVRKSVFETNSSSMHSLTIEGKDQMQQLIVTNESHFIDIFTREFGWGPDVLTDPYEKLVYLVTSYSSNPDAIDLIKEAIKDYSGIEINLFDFHGYIDHQSVGMMDDFIKTKQDIIDIVFNKKYKIIIDNDNRHG